MRRSFDLFSGFSSVSSVPAGSLANAASVGANTVNGPGPLSVATRSAASSAVASVLNEPASTAVSTMSFVWACTAERCGAAPSANTATIPIARFFSIDDSSASVIDGSTNVGRRRVQPMHLRALPEQALIHGGQPDEPVYGGARGRDLAELHAEQGGDEIEPGDGNQAPVERSHDHEDGRDDVDLLHDSLTPSRGLHVPRQCL